MHKNKCYSQLSKKERELIEAHLKDGKGLLEIAQMLKRNPSTIGRELKRNTAKRGRGAKQYTAEKAQNKTALRHQTKYKYNRFDEEMKQIARDWLRQERWSPELISVKGKEKLGDFISHEWLYRWIWKCKVSNKRNNKEDKQLYRYLRHGRRRGKRGNRRDSRGLIPNKVMIDKRPAIINDRRRKGDKEADLVMGKNNQAGLLILTDRKTRISNIEKINCKTAREVKKKIKHIIKQSVQPFKSITFDNDLAFALHQELAHELKIKTYFTHPYSSQEKGTVENRIGVLRRFFPKKTDFNSVDKKEIKFVEKALNNRPMRMFNYKSPSQVASP